MHYKDLRKSIENGEKFSIYLLEGEDGYFRSSAVEMLINAFCGEPSLNVATFSGASDEGDVLSSLNAFPLLSENRVTVIKEYYPTAAGLKGGIGDFIRQPHKNSVLVISNEKPCEALKKHDGVTLVSCAKADIPLLAKWIKTTANAEEITVSDAVCRSIAEYCGSDMTRIKNETDKLIAYAGKGGEITEETVTLLVGRESDYKIYEMTEHIARKRVDKALEIVNDMLEKGETPQKIISSFYNYFRKLLFVAISDKPDAELAKLLEFKGAYAEYQVKKTKEQAALFKVRSLKKAFDGFSDADYKVKSGLIDAGNAAWIELFSVITE